MKPLIKTLATTAIIMFAVPVGYVFFVYCFGIECNQLHYILVISASWATGVVFESVFISLISIIWSKKLREKF